MRTRRLISALVGGLLLLGTLAEAYFQGFELYNQYYLMPKEKYGVLTPLRWQDVVFLVGFCLINVGLFYLSCRLLKYALRREPAVPAI